MSSIRPIETERAPQPGGHYAQGVVWDGLLFISGQLPLAPGSGQPVTGAIEEQAEQALSNLKTIIEAAGSRIDCVLKTTVYITDVSLWGRVDAVYSRFFGAHRPARSIVPVAALHHDCLIEIEAIAALDA